MRRAVKVQACKCQSCGAQGAEVKTDVGNLCAPCHRKYELNAAIFVDLENQLKSAMGNWLSFWGTVVPLDELTGGDFTLASEIIANLEAEMLPRNTA